MVSPDPLGGDSPGAGPDFGAWAPGVLDSFLAIILEDRKSTSAGALVGREVNGRPQIDGVIATVQGGKAGSIAFDRENWGWVHEVRVSHYPESSVIAWFCARPNLNAVPTEVDVQTHLQFFGDGEYVMICVDPISLQVAAYRFEAGQPHSIGRGDLNSLREFGPMSDKPARIHTELIGASLIGLAIGIVAWVVAGAGSWPFP